MTSLESVQFANRTKSGAYSRSNAIAKIIIKRTTTAGASPNVDWTKYTTTALATATTATLPGSMLLAIPAPIGAHMERGGTQQVKFVNNACLDSTYNLIMFAQIGVWMGRVLTDI